ncbi:MAG: hypothetical protein AAF846_02860 [Chloroflexota bacterium]
MSKTVFDPINLPERPTAIYDTTGTRIGTFNPHTCMIHPSADNNYGPLKLLGRMAIDKNGTVIGKFDNSGRFSADTASV